MLESRYRAKYDQWLVEPLLKRRWVLKRHPLSITLLALATGIGVLPCLVANRPIEALALLFLSGFLDTLDGALARRRGLSSPLGTLCDIVSDRIVEFSVILGLFAIDPIGRGYATVMMLGSVLFCITSFLTVGIFSKNEEEKSFHYSPGLMERAEAFAFFAAMIVLPNAFFYLSAAFTTLVLWTAGARIVQFARKANGLHIT